MEESYQQNAKDYREHMEQADANQQQYAVVSKATIVLRLVTALIVISLLAYIAIVGLHTH